MQQTYIQPWGIYTLSYILQIYAMFFSLHLLGSKFFHFSCSLFYFDMLLSCVLSCFSVPPSSPFPSSPVPDPPFSVSVYLAFVTHQVLVSSFRLPPWCHPEFPTSVSSCHAFSVFCSLSFDWCALFFSPFGCYFVFWFIWNTWFFVLIQLCLI